MSRFLNGNAIQLCGAGAFCSLSFAVVGRDFIIAGAAAAATCPLDTLWMCALPTTAFFEAAFFEASCPLDANGAFVASSLRPASCAGQGRHTSQKALSHAAQRIERRPSGGHAVPMAHSGGRMGTRTSRVSPHVGHCICKAVASQL